MPLDLTTRRNAESATKAVANLETLELIPEGPYPGSDVHWPVRCGRLQEDGTPCPWSGNLFNSHMRRGRRHVGCTGVPGTMRTRLTDAELHAKLTAHFAGTAFRISTRDGKRFIGWEGGPETIHVTAIIGPNQGYPARAFPK